MKLVCIILIMGMVIASMMHLPGTEVLASEKEYKDLAPVHVHNGTVDDIAIWGNNLAWASGRGNITTGTVTGGAGNTFQGHYWGYDLGMSSSAIVWSTAAPDVTTRSDIYSTGLSGGNPTYLGTNTDYDETGVRIDGNKILYEGYSDLDVTLKVSTIGGTTYTTIPVWPSSFNYDISDDCVVALGDYSALQIYSTSGSLLQDWGQGYYATRNLRISGDYITYYNLMDFGNGAHVYVKNWKTNETKTIIYHMEGQPGGLDIEGNFVTFWAGQDPESVSSTQSAVFIYDIQAQKTFQVSPAYGNIYALAIGGGKIAWSTGVGYYADNSENYWNIYAADLPEPGEPPEEPADEPLDLDDHITSRTITLGASGTTQTIGVNEAVIFDHNDQEHAVVVTAVTDGGATLEIHSTPINITMATGEMREFDTDGDGLKDLAITLNSVDAAAQTAQVAIEPTAQGGGLLPFPGIGMILAIMMMTGLGMALYMRRNKHEL